MESQGIVPQPAQAAAPDSAPVVPVETPAAPVIPAEETPAVNTPDPAPGGTVPPEEQPKAVKELIDQRKRRQKAEQEAAYWRGVAEARAAGTTPPPPAVTPPVPAAPTAPVAPATPNIDDFATFDEYDKAMRAYDKEKEEYLVAVTEFRMTQKFQQQQIQKQQNQTQQNFQQRLEKAAEADPTILDIAADPTLPVSKWMVPVLQESDVAPELLKYLHNNRGEAARIASLPPMLAAKEMGVIEAGIKTKPAPEPPKKVSSAPEPIPTVTPSGGGTIDEGDLPIDEYIKRRNKAQFGR